MKLISYIPSAAQEIQLLFWGEIMTITHRSQMDEANFGMGGCVCAYVRTPLFTLVTCVDLLKINKMYILFAQQ